MKYIGDYAPIQSNIENIRNSLCGEIHSMSEIADQVLSMPIYGELSGDDVKKICDILKSMRK